MTISSPIPRYARGEGHLDLIRKLWRPTVPTGTQRIDLITTTQLRAAVAESPPEATAEGDSLVHVLWQADEARASIAIAGESLAIAPGDTAAIPAGDAWQLSPGQLAIVVAQRARSLALPAPPHHGRERYEGFNRITSYDLPPSWGFRRWKLSTPATLSAREGDVAIIGLYNTIALQHQSGVDLVPQGEVRVIRQHDAHVTIVPNGLSYVLTINAPRDRLA